VPGRRLRPSYWTAGSYDTRPASPGLAEEWFSVYTSVEAVRTAGALALRGILERIPAPTGFGQVRMEDEPVSVGLGVVDGGWLGLFCMGTRPEFRRRGAATALLHALATWGGEHGARRAYLQVMDENVPAIGVYARAGFETLYHYHYRERVHPCRL
jgi:ribosomal protein S18 acetylase RimI-like enzyme